MYHNLKLLQFLSPYINSFQNININNINDDSDTDNINSNVDNDDEDNKIIKNKTKINIDNRKNTKIKYQSK